MKILLFQGVFMIYVRELVYPKSIGYPYSSSSRLRRFATNPIPVRAARAPSNTDPVDDSVPVFGNSFCDLPDDSDVFPTCEFE